MSMFFADFYENPKHLRKYNGSVLPDVKNPNMSIAFFGFLINYQKHNGNPKIKTSKAFKDVPKSFGFVDFSENWVPALCFINSLLDLHKNNTEILDSWIPVF